MCESQLLTKLCQLQTNKGQHNGHSDTSNVLSWISTGALRHSNYVLAFFIVLATKFQNLVQKKNPPGEDIIHGGTLFTPTSSRENTARSLKGAHDCHAQARNRSWQQDYITSTVDSVYSRGHGRDIPAERRTNFERWLLSTCILLVSRSMQQTLARCLARVWQLWLGETSVLL